jgi:hypothetical protein
MAMGALGKHKISSPQTKVKQAACMSFIFAGIIYSNGDEYYFPN